MLLSSHAERQSHWPNESDLAGTEQNTWRSRHQKDQSGGGGGGGGVAGR